jgi:hypothetical protein
LTFIVTSAAPPHAAATAAASGKGAGQFDLLPPTPPQLAQIIGDPARAAGLWFEEKPTGDRLDHVLQETALRDPQALPLLEFTLAELYKLCSKFRARFSRTNPYKPKCIGAAEGRRGQRRQNQVIVNDNIFSILDSPQLLVENKSIARPIVGAS